MSALITAVAPNSPAARAGLLAGETLLSAGGQPIRDVLDYKFYTYEPRLTLTVRGADGAERAVTARKAEGEDLGLSFETYLMDRQRPCANKCVFCFVDQLPRGLRQSLYFKDDDARLSFLLGNYITLTNLSDAEFARVLRFRLSPLHISVHATDPALRVEMLGVPRAGNCLERLRQLADAGISMHLQIVVCPGLNDGAALAQTLSDLTALHPAAESIAVVPVGLTRHREGLYPLSPMDAHCARAVLRLTDSFAAHCRETHGTGLVYAADEVYLKAGVPVPPAEAYDDFLQLENGVGMMAQFEAAFSKALSALPETAPPPFVIATGLAAAPFLSGLLDRLKALRPELSGSVIAAENRLFGSQVDVAGLVCGRDLIEALRGQTNGARVLFPETMLRREGDLFLDDLTPTDVAQALGVPVTPVPADGAALLDAIFQKI